MRCGLPWHSWDVRSLEDRCPPLFGVRGVQPIHPQWGGIVSRKEDAFSVYSLFPTGGCCFCRFQHRQAFLLKCTEDLAQRVFSFAINQSEHIVMRKENRLRTGGGKLLLANDQGQVATAGQIDRTQRLTHYLSFGWKVHLDNFQASALQSH